MLGMIMAIDTSNTMKPGGPTTGRSGSTAAPTRTDNSSRKPETAAEAPRDSVVLSQEAQSLTKLQEAVENAPEVNSEKVDAIKRAIAEGRFEINADRLAEAILSQDDLLN